MASLLQIRDAVALHGNMQAQQLSRQLATPLPLVEAMLERLTAMGKVERIEQDNSDCLSGSCKSCPEGQGCSSTVVYRIKNIG
jgi:ferrous iron transport protein C